jgi:RHS repeat-associated protein
VTSIGLYNYKARFYDPYITHFLQPDSIVPNPYNPQSLNRYSYALNNPIRYNDPSGHEYCDGVYSSAQNACRFGYWDHYFGSFTEFQGSWDPAQERAAKLALLTLGRSLAGVVGGTADTALKSVYVTSASTNALVMQWGDNDDTTRYKFDGDCADFSGGGCSPGKTWDNTDSHWDTVLAFNTTGRASYAGLEFQTLVTHEAGHVFGKYYGGDSYTNTGGIAGDWLSDANSILEGGEAPITYRHASAGSDQEMFADMFTAWAFSAWNRSGDPYSKALSASIAMTANVTEWIPK